MPESDEGPFLNEERNLLKAIAERLGRIVREEQGEEELRESEEKYRLIFSNEKDAIILCDADTLLILGGCRTLNSAKL